MRKSYFITASSSITTIISNAFFSLGFAGGALWTQGKWCRHIIIICRQYTGLHLALSINKTKFSNNSYSFFSHKINLHSKKNPSNSGYVVQLIGYLLSGQGSIHLLCEIYPPFYLQSWYQKIDFVVLKNQNHKLISKIQTDLLI